MKFFFNCLYVVEKIGEMPLVPAPNFAIPFDLEKIAGLLLAPCPACMKYYIAPISKLPQPLPDCCPRIPQRVAFESLFKNGVDDLDPRVDSAGLSHNGRYDPVTGVSDTLVADERNAHDA